jgi:hypothetical protein
MWWTSPIASSNLEIAARRAEVLGAEQSRKI